MNNVFTFKPKAEQQQRFKNDRERAAEKNGIDVRRERINTSLNKIATLTRELDAITATTGAPTMPKPRRERTTTTIAGLTFQPVKQRFKSAAGKCTFKLETQEAYSYGWWRFVERIGPYLVFNNYRYSSTTTKHQYQLRSLLESLGLNIDLTIKAPKGLQSLDTASHYYLRLIADLERQINTKGSRKLKNIARREQIVQYQIKLATISMLQRLKDTEYSTAV